MLGDCPVFGWDRAIFLQKGLYDVVFWNYDENSDDSTLMYLLLFSCYTASMSFLLLTLPCQQEDWKHMTSWEGMQPRQLTPVDQGNIPHHVTSCSAIKAGGRKEGRGYLERWYLSSQIYMMKTCFPGKNCTFAY